MSNPLRDSPAGTGTGTRRKSAPSSRHGERGAALLLALAILLMGSLYVVVNSASDAFARIDRERADHDAQVLVQAKEALVAWSALRTTGPGHLLCPAADESGVAGTTTCGTINTRVGRLPWKTLGLPELRDSSGEPLWYAVSRCFLERNSDAYCGTNPSLPYPVNSDTPGQLNLSGDAPAQRAVAIIFAPGAVLTGQERSAANRNDVRNYLEGLNADGWGSSAAFEDLANRVDAFEALAICGSRACSGALFNDRVLAVTHADLFAVVENVVAKRVEREVKPKITALHAQWAALNRPFFPFAAQPPEGQTATPWSFAGVPGNLSGLFPAGKDVTPTNGLCVNATSGSTGTASVAGASFFCEFATVSAADQLIVRYTIGAGMGFFQPVSVAQMSSVAVDGETAAVSLGTVQNAFLASTSANAPTADPGYLRVTLDLTVAAPTSTNKVRIRAERPIALADDADLAWYFDNRWYEQTFYALSPDVAPTEPATWPAPPGNCGANCISVQGVGGSAQTQVAVVMGGRAIDGGARPGTTTAAYLEAENRTLADRVLAIAPRSTGFNDKPVVLRAN